MGQSRRFQPVADILLAAVSGGTALLACEGYLRVSTDEASLVGPS
jgi:hypothetical protein